MNEIEQAQSLGLDTSDYKEINGEYWLSPGDARLVLQACNPTKKIRPAYLSDAARRHVRKYLLLKPDTYVYALSDLLKVKVNEKPGKPAGLGYKPHKKHTFTAESLKKQQEAQRLRRERERAAHEQ